MTWNFSVHCNLIWHYRELGILKNAGEDGYSEDDDL